MPALLFGNFKFAYLKKKLKNYSFETLGHALHHLTLTFVNSLPAKTLIVTLTFDAALLTKPPLFLLFFMHTNRVTFLFNVSSLFQRITELLGGVVRIPHQNQLPGFSKQQQSAIFHVCLFVLLEVVLHKPQQLQQQISLVLKSESTGQWCKKVNCSGSLLIKML